jgi:hypothetical protein
MATWLLLVRTTRLQRVLRLAAQNDSARDYSRLYSMLSTVEFPYIVTNALSFALFKTFAVPSISALLAHTRQFEAKDVGRRYDDTDLLLRITAEHGLESAQSELALRRLNFIHGHYKISNDDYLYTLSLFVIEPLRWIERFGHRALLPVERRGVFNFYRRLGLMMNIERIPHTLAELIAWSDAYEVKHARFAKCNRAVAEPTVDLFLSIVPGGECVRRLLRPVVYSLYSARLCANVGVPVQPAWLRFLSSSLLRVRGLFVRYLLPARPLRYAVRRTPTVPAGCPIASVPGAMAPDHAKVFAARDCAHARQLDETSDVTTSEAKAPAAAAAAATSGDCKASMAGARLSPLLGVTKSVSFHPYAKTYAKGFKTECLGPASLRAGALGKLYGV